MYDLSISQKLLQQDKIPNSLFKLFVFLETQTQQVLYNVTAISKTLGLSRKTVRRDLKLLKQICPEYYELKVTYEVLPTTEEIQGEPLPQTSREPEADVLDNQPVSLDSHLLEKAFESFEVACAEIWDNLKKPFRDFILQFEEKEPFTQVHYKVLQKSIEICIKLDARLDEEAVVKLLTASLKQVQKQYYGAYDQDDPKRIKLWKMLLSYYKSKFPGTTFYNKMVDLSIKRKKTEEFQKQKKEADIPNVPYKKILKMFKEINPTLNVVYKKNGELPYSTIKTIQRTWIEYHDLEEWRTVFERVNKSKFFNQKWLPNFEWLCEINNFRKIMSGEYVNDQRNPLEIENERLKANYIKQNFNKKDKSVETPEEKATRLDVPIFMLPYMADDGRTVLVEKVVEESPELLNSLVEYALIKGFEFSKPIKILDEEDVTGAKKVVVGNS